MTPGQRIGAYEVIGSLGAGGMGEVYRATDTRLGRQVAIKVLPASVAQDADRLARFDREARTLAALNHPNIAAIHGVESIADGPAEAGHHVRALVMELVEGPTLAERIAQGPVPLDEALPIARQIADALAAAHEQGIVHRDLKPANIKVRDDGTVKVLDFGLAKALDPTPGSGANALSLSPTLTSPALMTGAGLILGTAAYMSPEQARGKTVDKRSDIWAFGCVVFEMLTGKRAFEAEDVSLTLSVVLQREPDFVALPSSVPPHVTQALRVCLRKDPRQRASDIRDVQLAMDGAFDVPVVAAAVHTASPATHRRMLWAAVAGALLVAAVAGYGWWRAARPIERQDMRFSVDLGPDAVKSRRSSMALSPDGTRIVFVGNGQQGLRRLFMRRLDELVATPLSVEFGAELSAPFFSPKGDWVGVVAGNSIWKVPVQGGPAFEVTKAPPTVIGASWGDDDTIVIASSTQAGLLRVPASGGTVELFAEGGNIHFSPQVLPGARAVLTTSVDRGNFANLEDLRIDVIELATGATKPLVDTGYDARYLPTSGSTGHVVFVRQGTLFAVKFDPARLETLGTPMPLFSGVGNSSLADGGGQFTFSNTGTFAYLSGETVTRTYPMSWMDPSGQVTPLVEPPANYGAPRFSPDGTRLAYILTGPKGSDVWVYDLMGGKADQLTFTAPGRWELAWAPDSKHLVYADGKALWWTRADGSGEAQKILDNVDTPRPFSFGPDGRLAFGLRKQGLPDIWTMPIDLSDPDRPKPGKPESFLEEQAVEVDAAFSRDGKFLAYASTEQGTIQLYVRPFPGPGGKRKISDDGGKFPAWSRSANQLFYLATDDRIMVVDYTIDGVSFNAGKPRVWAPTQVFRDNVRLSWDLFADGKRIVMFPRPPETKAEGPLHATFLLNFFDQIRRKVP